MFMIVALASAMSLAAPSGAVASQAPSISGDWDYATALVGVATPLAGDSGLDGGSVAATIDLTDSMAGPYSYPECMACNVPTDGNTLTASGVASVVPGGRAADKIAS